jgi:hypothetical protein
MLANPFAKVLDYSDCEQAIRDQVSTENQVEYLSDSAFNLTKRFMLSYIIFERNGIEMDPQMKEVMGNIELQQLLSSSIC